MPVSDKWNEWSLKVLEELTTLNNSYDQLTKDLENLEGTIGSKIDRINELLNGNGTPEKGIIVRLDRIEQNEQRRLWVMRTAIGAAIAAVVGTVAQWLKHG